SSRDINSSEIFNISFSLLLRKLRERILIGIPVPLVFSPIRETSCRRTWWTHDSDALYNGRCGASLRGQQGPLIRVEGSMAVPKKVRCRQLPLGNLILFASSPFPLVPQFLLTSRGGRIWRPRVASGREILPRLGSSTSATTAALSRACCW